MSQTNGGLSQEEFLILQEQLIDLRNVNYELREKLRKQSLVDANASDSGSAKKDALQFASRLLNRSKDRETEQRLESEVEILKQKLSLQEEEFRLQQQTFITELNKVVRNSEDLQKELDSIRNGSRTEESAENAADLVSTLQSSLLSAEEEKNLLKESLNTVRSELTKAEEDKREKDVFLRALEDNAIQLRADLEHSRESCLSNERQVAEKTEEIEELKLNLRESQNSAEDLQSKLDKEELLVKELKEQCESLQVRDREKEKDLLSQTASAQELQEKYDLLKKRLDEANGKNEELAESLRTMEDGHRTSMSEFLEQNSQLQTALLTAEESLKDATTAHSAELEKITASHLEEVKTLEIAVEEERQRHASNSDDILRVERERNIQELEDLKKKFEEQKNLLDEKVQSLNAALASKDEEKHLALKKQSHLIKELQKAAREERKRADSVEKLKEREWQVVDSDARSGHTYDGNDSVSSLSALESDNVELINKLTGLQRVHAEVVDRLRVVENENDGLRKEVVEKGELIEHWIRARPQTTSSASPQKPESALRKFLATTLAGDEQVSDLRDMNRKLQRMLEETLSKNIILQRDLQTLIERTEM